MKMKKLLSMVMILCLIISIMSNLTAFAVWEDVVTLFETDFENETAGEAPRTVNGTSVIATTANATVKQGEDGSENATKYIDTIGGTNQRFRMWFNEPVSTGVIVAEFDLNPGIGNVALGLIYENSATTYAKWPFFLSSTGDVKGNIQSGGNPPTETEGSTTAFTRKADNEVMNFNQNTWQHYKVRIDLTQKEVKAWIGGVETNAITGYEYFTEVIGGMAFYMNKGSTSESGTLFDNIKIYKENNYGNYYLYEDFEKDLSGIVKNDANILQTYITEASSTNPSITNVTKYLTFENATSGNVAKIMFSTDDSTGNPQEITTGKFYVEFDVMTGFGGICLSVVDNEDTSDSYKYKCIMGSGTVYSNPARFIGVYKTTATLPPASSNKTPFVKSEDSAATMALAQDEWQHIRLEVDMDNESVKCTLDGVESDVIDGIEYLDKVSGIAFRWANGGGTIGENFEGAVDNIKVYTSSDGKTSDSECEVSLDNVRTLGRTVKLNDITEFNWPMTGIEFETDGTNAYVYVATCNKTSYINVSVDGSDTCERILVSNIGWLKVADALSSGSHTIKITRSSEGTNGILSFSSVKTDDGTYIKPTSAKARKMEFIGDSYTVGYGNLEYGADSNQKTAANTDTWRSYAGYASRLLNADANIVAMSGKGVCMNYIATTTTSVLVDGNMSQQYIYANPDTSGATLKEWNFEEYIPQVVVVFLGTNDYNGTNPRGNNPQYFYEEYKKLLKTISSKYPDAHIFCCSKPSGSYGEYIQKAVEDMQNEKYHFITLTSFKASGVNYHPYYTEALDMGKELAEKINEAAQNYDIWQEGSAPLEKAFLNTASKKIYVGGSVSGSQNGDSVTLFIVDKNADEENISLENDVLYSYEAIVDENGKYEFLFEFENDINDYKFLINKKGKNISQTVNEITSVYDAIGVDLDITSDLTLTNGDDVSEIITTPSKVKAAFEIDNYFEENSGNYTAVVTFYDETGKLLDTHFEKEKEFGSDVKSNTVWYDIPDNASYAKAFLWTTLYQSMPLCNAQKVSFVK